jgi:hypothetical protein
MNAETLIRRSLSELADRAEEAPGLAARARAGVRRRRHRRSLVAVAAILVVGTAGGLLQTRGEPAPSRIVGAPATTAGRAGAAPPCPRGRFDAYDPARYGTPLGADDVVVEAMWCKVEFRGKPAPYGRPVAVEQRATEGLGPLVRALRQPDFKPTRRVICTLIGYAFSWQLWVRTTDGRWLRPRWPLTACGSQPKDFAVLDTVPFRTVRERALPQGPAVTERSPYPWQRDS